jgi:hypothetical protein
MRKFPALLLIFVLSALGAGAKTVPLPGAGASITLPDDWKVLDRPNVVFVAAAPGETTALGVTIARHPSNKWVNNPIFILEIQDAYMKRAAKNGASVKVVESGTKSINGVPAAYVDVEMTFSGNRTIYSQEYDIAANGKLFVLTFDTRDAFAVPVLEKIADSFRFDKPPQFPAPINILASRIEEVAGTVVGFALLIALALWIRKMILSRAG